MQQLCNGHPPITPPDAPPTRKYKIVTVKQDEIAIKSVFLYLEWIYNVQYDQKD